jgi:hypothetical protein
MGIISVAGCGCGCVQAISTAGDGAPSNDRVLEDPEDYNELPPPRALDASHFPSDEDLLRV